MLSLVFLSSAIGQAQTETAVKTSTAQDETKTDVLPTGNDRITAADVEAFLEGIVPQQLALNDVAGATVAVVKDGKLLFSKGYGYSDVEKKQPVLADKTLFRPGSISKLFTWTAVMQLHEQGKLDLDTDINKYLDFKIPEAFGKPITLKHILTHTPGFEEQIKDLFTTNQEGPNLGEYVKNHIPRRIFAPGTTPAYSNYGTAVAGYIVERISGQPFSEYIEEHIFKPLEMNNSTFVQPLPKNLASQMSKGYSVGSDEPKTFEIVNAFPAGSLSSTADDMARFMIAHLQNGQYGDTQILKPETAKKMHARLFALDDSALAMAHGFYEQSRNGKRIIGHGGDTVQFHSNLHLVLDSGVGFYVSYNSAGKGLFPARDMLWHAFLDRYFPYSPEKASTPESVKADVAAVSGTYMVSRRSGGSMFKMLSILGEVSVSANKDDTVSVSAFNEPNGKPKKFVEVAPMKFRDVNGQDTLIFKKDGSGQMQMIIDYPFMVFTQVGLWQNAVVMLPVLGGSLLIMLLTLILWFVSWLVRRHYGQKLELTRQEWWLRLLVRIGFALNLIFAVALLSLLVNITSNLDLLSDSGNNWIRLIQVIGALGVIGTPIVLFNAVHAWISKRYRIWGKLQATIFALASLGFLWFVFVGNLLSFTSKF
jgi:CubicO group peptidase (beta-lactamase class C family)